MIAATRARRDARPGPMTMRAGPGADDHARGPLAGPMYRYNNNAKENRLVDTSRIRTYAGEPIGFQVQRLNQLGHSVQASSPRSHRVTVVRWIQWDCAKAW